MDTAAEILIAIAIVAVICVFIMFFLYFGYVRQPDVLVKYNLYDSDGTKYGAAYPRGKTIAWTMSNDSGVPYDLVLLCSSVQTVGWGYYPYTLGQVAPRSTTGSTSANPLYEDCGFMLQGTTFYAAAIGAVAGDTINIIIGSRGTPSAWVTRGESAPSGI